MFCALGLLKNLGIVIATSQGGREGMGNDDEAICALASEERKSRLLRRAPHPASPLRTPRNDTVWAFSTVPLWIKELDFDSAIAFATGSGAIGVNGVRFPLADGLQTGRVNSFKHEILLDGVGMLLRSL